MSSIKVKVVRIGNSRGIRIPKVILDQYHINDEVELETKEDYVIIKPSHVAREGWEKEFLKMHENQDDVLLIDDSMVNDFDEEDWEW